MKLTSLLLLEEEENFLSRLEESLCDLGLEGGRERKGGEEREGQRERGREREREISINAEQVNFIWPNFRSGLNLLGQTNKPAT